MSGGMEMPGGWTMSMMWMRMPGETWLVSIVKFVSMWTVMMVVMMLPAALPMFIRFRCAWSVHKSDLSLGIFLLACGYFFVWTSVGFILFIVGVIGAQATMKWKALSYSMPTLIGFALLLAGIYQFTPWKKYGLVQCNSSVSYKPDISCGGLNELSQGIRQGIYCVICCLGPMLTLLALGAMEPLIMLVVTIAITAERVFPKPQIVVRIVGVITIIAGMLIVIKSKC
jgi:predicted metal-binding membrane protein